MKDLIYNQRLIPPHQWRYGFRSSSATGCGWIATYNAMRLMNYRVNIEDLIRWYTWQLPSLTLLPPVRLSGMLTSAAGP